MKLGHLFEACGIAVPEGAADLDDVSFAQRTLHLPIDHDRCSIAPAS